RNVLKCRLLLLRGKQPRPRLPKAKRLVAASLHLAHQEQAESHKQYQRSSVEQNQDPIAAAHFLHLHRYSFVFEFLGNFWSGFLEDRDVKLGIRRPHKFALELVTVRREVHSDFFHVTAVHPGHELAITWLELVRRLSVLGHQSPEHHAQEHDRYPEQNRLRRRTGIHVNLTFVPNPRVFTPGSSGSPLISSLAASLQAFLPTNLFRCGPCH